MEQKEQATNSYLTFKLGEEEFGAHVSQVLNILEMTKITEVPKSPEYMKGVINLRGMVLPVIDTRIKFSMPETEYTNNTCIIVMDIDDGNDTVHIGAIVDEVLSVIEIEESQIEPPPGIGSKYKSEFIYGMAKIEENFVMLLDMQKVLNAEELSEITDKSEAQSGKAYATKDEN
ncbi:MAG TPA: chemotaxis protein CheW [Atribacterota bacterium]|nr:chemotaxis protein CheW [Atribacterota bacterium]